MEVGLKSVRNGLAKLQAELNKSADAQRQQGQIPSSSQPLPPQTQGVQPMSLPSPLYLSRPDTPGAVPATAAASASAAVPTTNAAAAATAVATPPSGFALQPGRVAAQVTGLAANAATPMPGSTAPPSAAAALLVQENQTAGHQQGIAATPPVDQPQIKAEPISDASLNVEPTTAEPPASPSAMLLGSAVKTEPMTNSAAASQAAPSLVSALTTASPKDPTDEALQSLLDDGEVLMPSMPADLQAELMSSASSSFTGIATFGVLPQQLSATFGGSVNMLTDNYAAELLSSPRFALSEEAATAVTGGVMPAVTSEAAEAAAASVAAVNAAVAGNTVGVAAFNAATGRVLFCIQLSACLQSIAELGSKWDLMKHK